MKKASDYLFGFFIGLINSLLGACGGILTVAALKRKGLEPKMAHANAVAIILPITIISSIYYLLSGHVQLREAYVFIPFGVIGAIIGGIILPKLPVKFIKKLFSILVIWAGIRMIIR